MLQTFEGVVQRGHVRLPAGTPLRDGARVIVTVLPAVDEHHARRKANGWLGENVGDKVIAANGRLERASGRQAWRFDAMVTFVSRDPFGPIGYVDVDAETGTVLTDIAVAEEMAQHGERLECAPLPASS